MADPVNLPLFNVNQVPRAFREVGILSGYRNPHSSATDCIRSIFQLHNETVNIWTHFLSTWIFLFYLVSQEDVWTNVDKRPLLVFLLSCITYSFASSCAHTFSTMSIRSRHICFFFDYGGISLYSLGSAVAYAAYVMPHARMNTLFQTYYVPLAVVNTAISTSVACYSRFAESRRPRLGKVLRVLAFTYPFLFDTIPVFYRIFLCVDCTATEVNSYHIGHIIAAISAGFLFATHFPESVFPGCFDIFGHSHQLFHVVGIGATTLQIGAVNGDMEESLHAAAPVIDLIGTLGATMLSVIIIVAIICCFIYALFQYPLED